MERKLQPTMQCIDPRPATILVDSNIIEGIISGTDTYVTFESQNKNFVNAFPEGKFDTLKLNEKKCAPEQIDFIKTIKDVIHKRLNN